MDFSKVISETKNWKQQSVMVLPGLLNKKPVANPFIGKAWPKTKRNGRVYYKMKFDCFAAKGGKAFYVKGWSRKLEPNRFDLYADAMPAYARYPLLLDKEGNFRFTSKRLEDGSLDLMLDHSFLEAD